ncbi:DUF4405 domain-containing protein [Consotaella aegiceratis]|uniref:DUF4405 domain-containing protein n=1 Tax=Consotaella aegiceratis TaxID=3097961 RepID=UPI002F3F3110
MSTLINRFATPLTTGMFAVSTISGVALFFGWMPSAFHSMHVWLSMVLLVPFALHVWKNWRPLVGYAKKKTLYIPLILSLVVAAPFALANMSNSRGGNPAFQAIPLMTQARLADLAPVLKTTPDALVANLEQRGYAVASTDETLASVANASGASANELLFALMPKGGEPSDRRG